MNYKEFLQQRQNSSRVNLSDRDYYYRAYKRATKTLLESRRELVRVREALIKEAQSVDDASRQKDFQESIAAVDAYIKLLVEGDKKYNRANEKFPEFNADIE